MEEQRAPRRERKKQQTRAALIRAALELFEAKGYEHTAVREITDAVDVSERTFFRYFASKEDLVLSFVRDWEDALLAALATRPPEEEPLTVLRRAFTESLRRITADADAEAGADADADAAGGAADRNLAYLPVFGLIDSTPALLTAVLRHYHDHDETLVALLARREGVDPATDPRPRILASLFSSLVSLASRDWRAAGGGGAEAMVTAFDRYADQLGPGLFGHWTG